MDIPESRKYPLDLLFISNDEAMEIPESRVDLLVGHWMFLRAESPQDDRCRLDLKLPECLAELPYSRSLVMVICLGSQYNPIHGYVSVYYFLVDDNKTRKQKKKLKVGEW